MSFLDRLDRRPLSEAEVASVTAAAQRGDQAAQLRMVGAVYNMVLKQCHRSMRWNPTADFDDLVQEACFKLIRQAIPRFDPTRAQWITYASWWIRASIWREAERDRAMPLPAHAVALAKRDGTLGDLWRASHTMSFDEPLEGTDRSLHEVLASTDESVEDVAERVEATARIIAAAVKLDAKSAYTVLLRFSGRTLQQVAERFGFSRERVRQIEQLAMAELVERAHEQRVPRLVACPGWQRTCGVVPELDVGLCLSCFRALEQAAGAQAVELGPMKPRRGCSVEGCELRHAAKGLCAYHYERQRVRFRKARSA